MYTFALRAATFLSFVVLGIVLQRSAFTVSAGTAGVLEVGPAKQYKTVSAAATAAKDGDVIQIDAGIYAGDVGTAVWEANNLTIRGMGGNAHMKADGARMPEGKALWVIRGTNTTIEHIEFSEARVLDGNGAGIRQEGNNLTVRHCYFHDNQDGILAGNRLDSTILVEYSEFARNGNGDAQTHNIYVGEVNTFTLRYSFSHDSVGGQLVKSRAHTNYILYNRLSDGPNGTSNYELDFSNGGINYVIGNVIHQGKNSENYTLLTNAPEGATNPLQELYVINNTFVNAQASGIFISMNGIPPVLRIDNNIFAGPTGAGTYWYRKDTGKPMVPSLSNVTYQNVGDAGFVDPNNFNFRPAQNSPAVDSGIDPGVINGYNLKPVSQYVFPSSAIIRTMKGQGIDRGAFEYGDFDSLAAPTVPRDVVAKNGVPPTDIILSWEPSADPGNVITTYQIFRDKVFIGTTAGINQYVDKNLPQGFSATYQVVAVNAAGKNSSLSASVTAGTPRIATQAPLPSQAGWYEVANSQLYSQCPSLLPACSYEFAYSGGAFDTKRERLLIWGGGLGYGGNELYAFDLKTLTSLRLTNPAPQGSGESLENGAQPNSRATLDGLVYVPSVDRLYSFGGRLPGNIVTNQLWSFDFTTNKWQKINPTGPLPLQGVYAAHDPNSGAIFVHDGNFLYSYSITTNTFQKLSSINLSGNVYSTSIIDPVHKKFLLVGQGTVIQYDISPGSTYVPLTLSTKGGAQLVNSFRPGLAFDTETSRIIAWASGSTVYAFDIASGVWTPQVFYGGPQNPHETGTFKRWAYSPQSRAFVLANDMMQNIYLLKLSSQPTCSVLTPQSSIPQGFASPFNVVNNSNQSMMNASCSTNGTQAITLGNGNQTTYIYKIGYVLRNNAWQQVNYTGSSLLYNNWYAGNASGSTNLTAAELTQGTYFLSYQCQWTGSQWKCGCLNSTCNTNANPKTGGMWQIQYIKQ